jgi:hypothetical protein
MNPICPSCSDAYDGSSKSRATGKKTATPEPAISAARSSAETNSRKNGRVLTHASLNEARSDQLPAWLKSLDQAAF